MKIYLDTIGCRLNQAEIESMAHGFRAAGHEIVASAELAEMAVVNTCAVTNDAVSVSRGKIRQLSRAGVNEIVATGCWATLQPKEAAALPNVLQIVPNAQKDQLVAQTLNIHPSSFIPHPFDAEPLTRVPLPGLHRRTRAFIKVQDGCNNQCTFCITTVARGEARSRTVADVIQDIQFALDGGAKEIVLTGVHLGSWGYDFDLHLTDLVKAILHQTDVPRLRLSSLEPWDLHADFFSLWTDSRLMPHLHLPLQAGSDSTLKRMRRNTTTKSFRELISAAREMIPNVAITTDIIAGFPGETEDEFAQTLEFVGEMDFAGGHVFTYSPRPGTGAAKMKGQVQPEVRKKRNHILHDALEESAKTYREKFVGQTMSALWESVSEMGERGWLMEGLTENYLRAQAFAESPRWNEIDRVALTDCVEDKLRGAILLEEMA
ncbi:MAG: tRNA (N(6)-L-threonylcarbamoyladenosine(37)-C(2))-methylthiotransferase MtaB [Anaerolineales bacterium]|nr:tRNA (N(6)-L-threonylcarbamoyladenosine(37)-C(2))-methylthiotransferase MtaB [Anaerolineales bacterium]